MTWAARRVAAMFLTGAFCLSACAPQPQPEPGHAPSLSLQELLGGADTLHERAVEPRAFSFPADHGPHPEFRTEWWYFTGNVTADDGREFAYHVTFFRSALTDTASFVAGLTDDPGGAGVSPWRTRHAYMAHFAVSDIADARFEAAQRFARDATGLAGARAVPFRVWTGDWEAASLHAADIPAAAVGRAGEGAGTGAPAEIDAARSRTGTAAGARMGTVAGVRTGTAAAAATSAAASPDVFPLRLRAAEGDVAIDLVLEPGKPPVLQGDAGLSRKGPEPGNASYYYSLTRLPTSGTIRSGGRTHAVTGTSWLDREWSTSVLSPDIEGWDWMSLQLDDGTELMVYRLRRHDGSASPFSAATFVAADGTPTYLSNRDFTMTAVRTWRSNLDGTAYPVGWRVSIPSLRLDLSVDAAFDAQELDLAVRYWEGAVRMRGSRGGRDVGGRGFLEMTGYAERTRHQS
jgi:predicted secreted hydrolase